MDIELTKEIIACLPAGKTRFTYYRERYAALLLKWMIADGQPLTAVKKSRYASLLQKEPVRQALAGCGDGHFHASHLDFAWAEPSEHFLLTLGTWSQHRSYAQTSRHGHNLVLQVNFHDGYRRLFDECVAEDFHFWFRNHGHPVLGKREDGLQRHTLGWIRLDIDFSQNEAVIEEIQTDWVRATRRAQGYCRRWPEKEHADYRRLERYCNYVLQRVGKIWPEALLSAALWFLREEIGIKTVWYHTHASGAKLKRIEYDQPPRSMYSTLPRKFCFEISDEHPGFLLKTRGYRQALRKHNEIRWFKLVLAAAAGGDNNYRR